MQITKGVIFVNKKLIFVFTVLILCSFAIMKGQEIKYGVQAGAGVASAFKYYPNKNEYTNNPDFGISRSLPVLSYNFNLYVSYLINERFGVAVEPGFIQKGFADKFVDTDLTHNKTYLSYFQLPVLAEFKLENGFTLTFGPEFGYLISAKMKSLDISESMSLMHYYQNNRFDFGFQGGGYYSFSENLDLGVKAGASLTNLEKFYVEVEGGSAFIEVRRNAMYFNVFARYNF